MKPAAKDAFSRAATTVHANLYRWTGGRVGQKIGKTRMLLLTHTGRSSGRPHTTPLNFLADGDRRMLVASYGGDDRHPQWYQNLLADPEATIQIGGRTERVRARTATAEEKATYWPQLVAMYPGYEKYQRKTQREIPVVVLDPA